MHVIVFDSTHAAISAEKLLKSLGISTEIIPTPREITASCGLSIRVDGNYINTIKEEIVKANLSINGIYQLVREANEKRVIKLT